MEISQIEDLCAELHVALFSFIIYVAARSSSIFSVSSVCLRLVCRFTCPGAFLNIAGSQLCEHVNDFHAGLGNKLTLNS